MNITKEWCLNMAKLEAKNEPEKPKYTRGANQPSDLPRFTKLLWEEKEGTAPNGTLDLHCQNVPEEFIDKPLSEL